MGAAARRAAAAPLLAAGLALAACGDAGPGPAPPPAAIPDPTTLARATSPNDALVCPERACAAEADRAAPVYAGVSPDALFAAWRDAVQAAPRTEIVASDPSRLLLLARQRSRVFRFVDTVVVRVLPAGDGGASFAAHSGSGVGWYDLDVNETRLEAWQAAVERRLGRR